jgi:hypothetical protein
MSDETQTMNGRILTRGEIRSAFLAMVRIGLLLVVTPILWVCLVFIGSLFTGIALIDFAVKGDARMLREMRDFWSREMFAIWNHH